MAYTYPPNGVNREKPHGVPWSRSTIRSGRRERSYDAAGRLVERPERRGRRHALRRAQVALVSETRAASRAASASTASTDTQSAWRHSSMTEVRAFDAVGNLLRGSDAARRRQAASCCAPSTRIATWPRSRSSPRASASGPLTIQLEHRSDGQKKRVLRGGDDQEFVYDAFGRSPRSSGSAWTARGRSRASATTPPAGRASSSARTGCARS